MRRRRAAEVEILQERRPLLSHINELVRRLRRILIALGAAFFFAFAFGVKGVQFHGYTIPIPYPSIYHSIAYYVIRAFVQNELPPGLHLININPSTRSSRPSTSPS